jgi:hypothetical protein
LFVRKLSALAALALLAVAVFTACGSDSDDVETASPTPSGGNPTVGPQLLDQPEPAQAINSQVTEPANGVVDIVASGALFQQNSISVSLGEAATCGSPVSTVSSIRRMMR